MMRGTTVVLAMLAAGFQAACATPVGPVDPVQIAQRLGFLRNGETTKQEVLHRMGTPGAVYERDRLLTYPVVENQLGKIDVGSAAPHALGYSAYTLVLVFDERDVLSRHSLVFKK